MTFGGPLVEDIPRGSYQGSVMAQIKSTAPPVLTAYEDGDRIHNIILATFYIVM